jgi:putative FmdB family regulatory protein
VARDPVAVLLFLKESLAMPTYEYRCESCGHEFEELQSFKDEPLKVCPKCHEEKLRRLFGTGAAILFKGSGFYETDYRSESYKKAAKAEQEAGGKSNGEAKNGETKKSETKTAEAKSPTPPSSS